MPLKNAPNSKLDSEETLPTTSDSSIPPPLTTTMTRTRGIFQIPLPNHVWNPLLTLPVNMRCPCRSGKKFKQCCRPKLPKAVSKENALKYLGQMKKPDLFFITPENKHHLEEVEGENQ